MSDGENHHHGKNEIIIIKRHGGDHDGAHGGAWKIAYADFMTAMMAFFLVMWLVNAANEETKASIASYFNPIQLNDPTPAKQGVEKPSDQAEGEQKQLKSDQQATNPRDGDAAASGDDMTSSSGENSSYSEANLFENPYAVLAEIAQEVGQQANVSSKGEGGASQSGPATGASGGEAYRDPFDPDYWSGQVADATAPVIQDSSLPETPQSPTDTADAKQVPPAEQTDQAPADVAEQNDPQASDQQAPQETAMLDASQSDQMLEGGKPASVGTDGDQDAALTNPGGNISKLDGPDGQQEFAATQAQEEKADELKDQLFQALTGVPGKLAEGIVVTPAEGGTLVTISDQSNTPMFDLGSAVPRPEMVLAMEKIGAVLESRPGSVIIRGHTDARPYHGGSGDNWTLSMNRAHAAYFMLVRGGLEEKRIEQLTGFADRRPQDAADPMDDVNRRIEILISDG